jgi:uncharacterized membrane protein (DUF485 family)
VDTNHRIEASEAFNEAASRHSRAIVGLCIGFVAFYFALLVGAAYFREAFTAPVMGRVNAGLLFALAQYFAAGLVAWLYTRIMRETDRAMDSFKQ